MTKPKAYNCEVDLERINSLDNLLIWSRHLCRKNWMTTERLAKFMDAVAEIKSLNLGGRLPACLPLIHTKKN